jgi:hypothetical protein
VGILLTVGAIIFSFGDPVLVALSLENAWGATFALFGVGLAWLGYALWSDATEPQAVPVTARGVPVAG